MIDPSPIQTLFAYHWHTTRRLMAVAANLDEAAYTEKPEYGHGSIHDLLFHLLRTDYSWRLGLETGNQPASLSRDDFPDLAALQRGFEQEEQAWNDLLNRLSAEELAGTLVLTSRRGRTVPFQRWRILHHVVLHGMQHHTELAQLLTAKGQSPGDIDFIFFQ